MLDLSPSLTAAERAQVHQIAGALGLQHESLGQGPARHLRVSKGVGGHVYEASSGVNAIGATCDDMVLDKKDGWWESDGEALPAGEPFGMLRLVGGGDTHGRGARGGGPVTPQVELVLLPYHFTKLTEIIQDHFAEALKAAAAGKALQPAAMGAAGALKVQLLEYYRSIPNYYLRPLRAVVRKSNSSAVVQLAPPEFREQLSEDKTKSTAPSASLPVVSLPPALKGSLEVLRQEKGRELDMLLAANSPSSVMPLDHPIEAEGNHTGSAAARMRSATDVRRARGGTPALFESLQGRAGNYGGSDSRDCRSNKAALTLNPFNIPRGNLLVHVRRMRLAFLGHDQAGRMDKRPDSRHDRSTHWY